MHFSLYLESARNVDDKLHDYGRRRRTRGTTKLRNENCSERLDDIASKNFRKKNNKSNGRYMKWQREGHDTR